MRLIDADELIVLAENTFARPGGFINLIEETKTAYDVDAVVADIEDFREEAEQFGFASALSDIVEVVRNGGAHE